MFIFLCFRVSKFITKSVKVKEIDYSNMDQDYVLLERKYGVHLGIKKMAAITTKNGLTRRNIIVVTDSNDVKNQISSLKIIQFAFLISSSNL